MLGPDGGGIGNGKGDPGEKAVVLNWLFCESIWPIKVLKACCIAYFFKFEATHEKSAESPTPTPIQKRGDPMFDDGGGGENCGLTPTEEVPWLLEEMLAKHSVPSFISTTCLGVLGEAPDWEAAINFLGFLKRRGREKEECAYEMCLGLLGE